MFDIRNFELPTHLSRRVQTAIDSNLLVEPDHQAAFIRLYFQTILPDPKPHEYEVIPGNNAVIFKWIIAFFCSNALVVFVTPQKYKKKSVTSSVRTLEFY